MIRMISAGDRKLMLRVNRWLAPKWVRVWMVAATRAGDGWLWWGLGALIAIAGGPARLRALLATGMAVAIGSILFKLLKRAIGRERPCAYETHRWATLLPPDRFSFPSGHTINAFAVAVPMGIYYPEMLFGLLFCALSVAASRVVLGLHFLSDVVAGILIGTGLGIAAAALVGPLL